ncbi:MAG: 2-phospho-L-lactate guanylyltransferase [Candidatus Heimdallarchaeota archaeon]
MTRLDGSQVLVLIPIKDFSDSKTRLRAAFPIHEEKLIERLVEVSFSHLIGILSSLSLLFGVISPSPRILDQCKNLGGAFVYRDTGENLNRALFQAVQTIPEKQPILIIMPDLPFITREFIKTLIKEIKTENAAIVPSISMDDSNGTAILYLKDPCLLSFQFGEKSYLKHLEAARKINLDLRVLRYDPFARDLDTVNDIRFLRQNLHLIHDPRQYLDVLSNLSIVI